jgi:hypothetical protein
MGRSFCKVDDDDVGIRLLLGRLCVRIRSSFVAFACFVLYKSVRKCS